MKQLGFAQPTEMLRGLHFYTHHQRIYPTAFLKATVNVLFTGYVSPEIKGVTLSWPQEP